MLSTRSATFAALTAADLLPLVFQHLDTKHALRLAQTCVAARLEFARLFQQNARRTLAPFLRNVENFFDRLDLHEGLISGSLCVRILQREPASSAYASSDMDVYVPLGAGECMKSYLVTYEGYKDVTVKTQKDAYMDRTDYNAIGGAAIRCVYKLTRDEQIIDIVESKGDVSRLVLCQCLETDVGTVCFRPRVPIPLDCRCQQGT